MFRQYTSQRGHKNCSYHLEGDEDRAKVYSGNRRIFEGPTVQANLRFDELVTAYRGGDDDYDQA